VKERKRFFFEKKNQKTFVNLGHSCCNAWVQNNKSLFGSFSTEKEHLF